MVPHKYLNASDNMAQYCADQIGLQEVTAAWYLANMCDEPLFCWTSDDDADMGLDMWRLLSMIPDNPRIRLFVQRKDMERLGLDVPKWDTGWASVRARIDAMVNT